MRDINELKDINMKSWEEFKVEDVFDVFNSNSYHINQLETYEGKEKPIPYITRTNNNNGLKDIVNLRSDFKLNPGNVIIFGAENATFFYQPYPHITGNKMYGIKSENIQDRHIGLFITHMLNQSVKNCGFSYGQGLTGTREKRRSIMLPIDDNGDADWNYMREIVRNMENERIQKYLDFSMEILESLEYKEIPELDEKDWHEFDIREIFKSVQRGKRTTKNRHRKGDLAYVSSTASNNGVDGFISRDGGMRVFSNCLSLANSGSVGACFYEPFEFIASDHVTHLKNEGFNKYIYLFMASMLNRLSEKYNFNREISDTRLLREKILLPVNKHKTPDYKYMEQYIKNIMFDRYSKYHKLKRKV